MDESHSQVLTGRILKGAFVVANALGTGFLEKVYRNALAYELRKQGMTLAVEKCVPVFYEGVRLGDYRADLLVEETVFIETKVARVIDEVHVAQLLNCLKATHLKTGLLLNFGTARIGIKRVVL